MKIIHLFAITLATSFSCSAFAQTTPADDQDIASQISVGVGLGTMYSGLGANVAWTSPTDLKYVSAGCTAQKECGLGIGWIKTDLFDSASNKHGMGIYLSKVDEEWQWDVRNVDGRMVYDGEEKDVYGLGLSYTYFMNGINKSGTTAGVSFHATNSDYDDKEIWLQLGYQF